MTREHVTQILSFTHKGVHIIGEVWTGWEACLRSDTGLEAELGWELSPLSPFIKKKAPLSNISKLSYSFVRITNTDFVIIWTKDGFPVTLEVYSYTDKKSLWTERL